MPFVGGIGVPELVIGYSLNALVLANNGFTTN